MCIVNISMSFSKTWRILFSIINRLWSYFFVLSANSQYFKPTFNCFSSKCHVTNCSNSWLKRADEFILLSKESSGIKSLLKDLIGTCLAAQWLGLCAYATRGMVSILGPRTKIPPAPRQGRKRFAYTLRDLHSQVWPLCFFFIFLMFNILIFYDMEKPKRTFWPSPSLTQRPHLHLPRSSLC